MDDLGITDIAALIADETRARTLLVLMDGRYLPAGELAIFSNVSPATMSAHLSKLVGGGLLKVESQGKHRYYRLAGPKIAALLETFSTLVPVTLPPDGVRSGPPGKIRFARSCYRHLAGQVAVEVNLAAQKRELWVRSQNKEYKLTRNGAQWLLKLGISINGIANKRGFARACLDWSERQYHLSGLLGTLLLDRFLELKWMVRAKEPRALRLTHAGRLGMADLLGLKFPDAAR